ncbi:MAG: GGDEF domain-containing protein [Lachnospiraceae bacterium]|nr:GGDEF domain-containing protein [Lachnospiraceae bacterium]
MGRKKLVMFRLRYTLFDRVLLAGMTLLVIITMVLFYLYTGRTEENQIDFVRLVMEKTSLSQKERFETFVDDKVALLQALAAYPEIYEMNPEVQAEFVCGRSEKLGFHHIFVMNRDGNGFYFDEGVIKNQRNESFYTDVMDNEVYITEPFYKEEGLTIMTVCVSVYDRENQKNGVLCGAVDLSTVQEMIAGDEMLLSGDCFILDRSGAYVTEPDSGNIRTEKTLYDLKKSEVSLIQQAFLWEDDRSGTIVLEDREYLARACYLPDYTWTIVQCIPMDKIVQQFESLEVLQTVLFAAIVALIACIARLIYCWNKSDKETYADALTKCSNRAACMKMISYLEKKTSEDIMIIYMDLNKFKYVNDTFGHDKGDELLKIFSRVLEEILGKRGFVCRMGGDEFVSIQLALSEAELSVLWQAVEERLLEESRKLDFAYTISSSYGFAVRPKGENGSLEELMQQADEKMYAYKQARK